MFFNYHLILTIQCFYVFCWIFEDRKKNTIKFNHVIFN